MFGKVIRHCSDVVMPLLWPMGADLVICQFSSLHVLFPLIEFLAQDSLCKVIAHYFLSRVILFYYYFATSPLGFNNQERVLCIEA